MFKKAKKVLFITSHLPYPLDLGSNIVTIGVLKSLVEHYDVFFFSLLRYDQSNNNVRKFLDYFNHRFVGYRIFKLDYKVNKRNVFNLLKSYLNRIPFSVQRNKISKANKFIKNIVLSNNYDVIFIDHYIAFQFINNNGILNYLRERNIKIVLLEHNVEYLIWERYAQKVQNLVYKFFLKLESYRVKKYESKIIQYSDKVICLSDFDKQMLIQMSNDSKKFVCINTVSDCELIKNRVKKSIKYKNDERNVLFVGTLSWQPNLDGIIWFIKDIWPYVTSKDDKLKLRIIGKNPPQDLVELCKQQTNIDLIGFVEDLDVYYNSCEVFIAPLRFGSGIKIKIINAMSRGVSMVTTSIGVEGLDVENYKHLIIADDERSFGDAILKLINSKTLRQKLGLNAKKFVSKNHSYDLLKTQIKNIIDNL